ncbi:MAG: formate--tetrahydrofolate ligase, partial [Oscillospiraceae bacterium]|nr:formate--tetrahydrofolate ligase [Oscillospiraceae bacterium]
ANEVFTTGGNGISGLCDDAPGLPKVPAAENIDVDENGKITGLF